MFSNLHGASDTLCLSFPFFLWPSSIISSLNLWQFVDRLPLLVPVHDVARKGHLPAQHQRRNRTAAASAPRGTSRPPHVLGRVPREVKHYDVLAVHAVNTCTVQYRGRGGSTRSQCLCGTVQRGGRRQYMQHSQCLQSAAVFQGMRNEGRLTPMWDCGAAVAFTLRAGLVPSLLPPPIHSAPPPAPHLVTSCL